MMAFCKSCGTQLDEGAKFCRTCGTQVDQPIPQAAPDATTVMPPVEPPAAVPGHAAPAAPVPGYAPPVAPAPGGSKKSKPGLIIGLIAAVMILGILGGGLAFAMSKGYGWLPDNLTRKARAEAALDIVEAFGAQDFGELQDLSTGELKDLLKKYEDELSEGVSVDAMISNKEWDGEELTFEIEIDDESSDVTIEPDDSSTDVKVVIEGDDGGRLDIELEYDDGWKATDTKFDGESFVEELASQADSENAEDSSEDEDAYSDDSPDESEYSDDESEDSYEDLDAEQTECFDNQIDVESGASESSSGYEDLAGTVDDYHPLVVDDGWFDEAPVCPTTGDYYELDSDGIVYGCPEHGYYGDYDY